MAYDRADWHYGGNYPADLPPENGGTHIGMFLAWAILNGLESQMHREDSSEALGAVRARRMTGREFLVGQCDEKFTTNDLNEEGNAFAGWYYGSGEAAGAFLGDYEAAVGGSLPTLYHVADTWENYDRLAPVISRRFAEWKRRPEPGKRGWWPFRRGEA
jgi:hypothetical protein